MNNLGNFMILFVLNVKHKYCSLLFQLILCQRKYRTFLKSNKAKKCSILAPLLPLQLLSMTTVSHLTKCQRHTAMQRHHDHLGLHSLVGFTTSYSLKSLAASLKRSCATIQDRPVTFPLMKTLLIACQVLSPANPHPNTRFSRLSPRL